MTCDVECLVVGGGVVGLAVARELGLRGREVALVERNRRLGQEISARNSGVIHAGIYYPPGSLRARLSVRGRNLLYRFASDHGVAIRRTGKLLVATAEPEVERLKAIAATAAANGVGDLVRLSGAEARGLEAELHVAGALLSPSTGVIDATGLVQALEKSAISCGASIAVDTRVTGMAAEPGGFRVEMLSGDGTVPSTIKARAVVLAAGLGASDLAARVTWAAGYAPPITYPAKGHYFTLATPCPFQRLIYPMPDGAWLGIHLTLDICGRARFGPDLEWRDEIDYAFDDRQGARRAMFELEIRRYWPGLPEGALRPDDTGVRPKIYAQGAPAADFAIHGPGEHGLDGLVALYGIESPGLTSCLAIAELVADRIEGRA